MIICSFFVVIPWMAQSWFGPKNHPPEIEQILLDPAGNFTPGSDITISAVVDDEDGDPLTYRWESEGGLILEPAKLTTSWELHTAAEPLSYEQISLTVSDGKETVSRSRHCSLIRRPLSRARK